VSRRLWAIYALFIVYGTTIPFDFSDDPPAIARKAAALSWNPLTRADGRRLSIPDGVQNVMLFVPFGVLGGLACRRRVSSTARLVAVVTGAGVGLSVLVEAAQILTVDRVASTSDVMTNGLGTVAGVLAGESGRRRWLEVLRRYGSSRWMAGAWTWPALVALAVLAVAAWQPFDFTLDVGEVGSKLRALLRDPWQQGPLTDEGTAVVLYALATVAFDRYLAAAGTELARVKAVGASAALVLVLELSQVVVDSRTPAGSDAVVRLAGVAVGAVLLSVHPRHVELNAWLAVLFLACVASAAAAAWTPFTATDIPQAVTWFPLLGYYGNNWFPAVSHMIELALTYFPFGFVLGSAALPRTTVKAVVVFVTAAAAAVEQGQVWFAGRHADVTDVAFSVLGAALGVWFATSGAAHFEKARAGASPRWP
jgi:glycopeptide antibiotics resistance protein